MLPLTLITRQVLYRCSPVQVFNVNCSYHLASKDANIFAFLLTIDQGSRYIQLLVMMRRRMLLVMVRRMYLQQVRSRLGEGRRRWFPRSGNTSAGGNVLVLTAELVTCARGGRTGAIRDSVSVIIVANLPVIIVVVVVVVIIGTATAIVCEARGNCTRCWATTTTSTATDTTTANAVDLYHFAVDRSRRLGSTRRGRDAATDHHHQTISPPPPPRSATAPPSPVLPPLLRMHHVYQTHQTRVRYAGQPVRSPPYSSRLPTAARSTRSAPRLALPPPYTLPVKDSVLLLLPAEKKRSSEYGGKKVARVDAEWKMPNAGAEETLSRPSRCDTATLSPSADRSVDTGRLCTLTV
ncbi:hypothetical protein ALC57_12469 [Trachymyrmex cornetzi]|uniref:Uncharacterized protein n=1 Tax=Trachymyrmex cornetzi TaxID=471704 RepID=A0A195DR81_9HYME|nr:hypothetical protein ALC57_12469 [Trachymyrmex cornetzi]